MDELNRLGYYIAGSWYVMASLVLVVGCFKGDMLKRDEEGRWTVLLCVGIATLFLALTACNRILSRLFL